MSRLAVIEEIEKQQLKTDIPEFAIGDTIRVNVRIVEGGKERVQAFSGTVIARKGTGISESFSVYRVAYGAGIERVFVLHSPGIVSIEVLRKGKTRRSKLYHIRGAFGKKARIKEKISARVKKEKPSQSKEAAPAKKPVAEEESSSE